jgi:hypothetical protein
MPKQPRATYSEGNEMKRRMSRKHAALERTQSVLGLRDCVDALGDLVDSLAENSGPRAAIEDVWAVPRLHCLIDQLKVRVREIEREQGRFEKAVTRMAGTRGGG